MPRSDGKIKIKVLSSYIYEKGVGPQENMGRSNKWYKGFVKALLARNVDLNKLDIDFVGLSTDRSDDFRVAQRFGEEGAALVICPGTDAAVRWSKQSHSIPTVYFGAHPENNGIELHERANICGVRLNLPLIWSPANFKTVKELLPNIEHIYFPLNRESEFVFDNVRSLYKSFREKSETSWIPHNSHYIGHRSITFLCESIDCEYFEGPYSGTSELGTLLESIRTVEKKLIVGFNDTTLVPGAIDLISKYVRAYGVPLLWVNNFPVIQDCGVADFSSDFFRVGMCVGDLAHALLFEGATPKDLGLLPDPGQKTGLNLSRCAALNIDVPAALRSKFDIAV
ncbi:MAG TPA: hypothetical protein VGK97_09455 [Spongiibacteraceae bacterium]|jgi:ABC-type uncharacterized transport system substrate-binding protein